MAHVDRIPLGAATLARKYYLDINTGTYAAPTWTPINGVESFVPKQDPTLQNDSDFDSNGFGSQSKTAINWSAELKCGRKVTAASATVYDPGQEAIRAAARAFGATGIVDVRYYEVTSGGPTSEAFRGFAEVTWAPDGGEMDALDSVSITLTGRGELTTITHPDGAPAAVPVISALSPYTDAAAGGAMVQISGTGFLTTLAGATGVKFGATNAPSKYVLNDNVIVVVVPAHAQGSVNVTVENAVGISISTATFVYTA